MRRWLLIARALALCSTVGCASLRPARPVQGAVAASSPERCAKLARDAELQHIFAILMSGAGTGGAALAPGLTNEIARDSVLGVAAAAALTGAVLGYTAGVASADYAKECQ